MTVNAFTEDIKAAEEAAMRAWITNPADINAFRNTPAEVPGNGSAADEEEKDAQIIIR